MRGLRSSVSDRNNDIYSPILSIVSKKSLRLALVAGAGLTGLQVYMCIVQKKTGIGQFKPSNDKRFSFQYATCNEHCKCMKIGKLHVWVQKIRPLGNSMALEEEEKPDSQTLVNDDCGTDRICPNRHFHPHKCPTAPEKKIILPTATHHP